MAHDAIDIREFVEDDLEALVAFSLRVWEPVFASVQEVLGDEIFLRLHSDWRASQEEAVRSICMNDERDVYVAVAGARPVGFVAVALNAFHERMGVIEIIGVDPDYQRRGVGERLTEFAADHMRRCGMDIAGVETRDVSASSCPPQEPPYSSSPRWLRPGNFTSCLLRRHCRCARGAA
jgi:ribosomal protein S18 acetylase RimI-like enzyme